MTEEQMVQALTDYLERCTRPHEAKSAIARKVLEFLTDVGWEPDGDR